MFENMIGDQLSIGRTLKILDYFALFSFGTMAVGGAVVGGGGAIAPGRKGL